MARGGRRPGAGRPKGSKSPGTLTKELAREALRERVIAELGPLLDAQIEQAKGLKYLVTRDKATGKFIRVTATMARARALGQNEEIIEVWEKDPSIAAFTDLMNRALDKAQEPQQEIRVQVEANEAQLALLDEGRRRNAERKAMSVRQAAPRNY